MAQTPNPKSQEQILGEMLADFSSRTGINDFNVGSLTTQLFEVVSLMVARTSGDAFQILRDLSVDRAEGEALRRIAKDEGLRDIPARVATGSVKITDTSFEKISTKIYAGAKAPNIGSTTILVSNASLFPASGSVYIGRGTPNIEGPLAYTTKTQIGSYWELTLSVPTTKFHNINESVVLAQGGTRTIPSGTIVRAPATGASNDINFVVTQAAVILDGETEISGVQVSAQEPGTEGNVPIGSIKEFGSNPFPGAAVTNTLPFKTGRNVETDDQLRIRIKRARLSRGLGTALAVKSSVIGATPSDENATVVSSEILTTAEDTTLFIDDGTGYEQKTNGAGIEYLVDSAIGGETNFQLETGGRQTSIAKAFIVSNLSGPFDIVGGDKIAISVGGVVTEHTFQNSDFISPGGATAFEVVASINSNSSLGFEATTSEGGTKVVIQAKDKDNEDVQATEVTSGRNAAELMGFQFNRVETLRLFKNKQPLSKDGNKATIKSERQANWSTSISTGDTLIISVDNTAFITYTFNDADFIAEGNFSSVSATNSLESWANVINSKITGVTASVVGEKIFISSNLGVSSRAKLEISPSSTLVTKNLFSVSQGLISTGKDSDYEFSRNTGQIKLKKPLSPGDELTAGSSETEARIESSRILGGSLTLVGTSYLWFIYDDKDAELISTGVSPTTLISVSKPSTNIVRYSSPIPSAFSNVQVGDYIIVWSEELNAFNRLEGRVHAVTANDLDIKVTPSEFSSAVVQSGIIYQDGFVVVRTSKVPQKLKVTSGTKFVTDIADELNNQVKSGKFTTIDDEIIVATTNTKTTDGSILLVTVNNPAKTLGFTLGDSDVSKDSLIAFYESGYKEGFMPAFVHSAFSSNNFASPPDSFLTSINSALNLSTLNLDPNYIVGYLNPYGTILDALSTSETTVLNNFSGSALTLDEDPLVKRLRQDDRYYLSQPLDLGHADSMAVILDNDITNKTFDIPFYRTATTNTSLSLNPNNFNAFDTDGGPTTPFTQFFGTNFSFSNFKVLMRAKKVIDEAALEDAILYRSVKWGRSGEKINIGYTYPTVANSSILHTVKVGEDIDVRISLKSGAAVSTTIDSTTEWNVTITANTPVAGVDQVTYTWSGTGSNPGLGGLSGGEYVTITQGSELDKKNTGTFRVSTEIGFTPTPTSFSIVRANGEAVVQNDVATLVANVFNFFNPSNTTALDIVNYVNSSNLNSLISAEIVDDGGTSGSGVIDRSTAEANDFSISSYYLSDGINWIESSNISGSPQFSFKRPLSYISDTGYAFNNGEVLKLVPTSIEQASRFVNILSVTGYTTLGSVKLTSREGRLELSTNLIGGRGSIQIVGGTANKVSIPVLSPATSIDNSYILANFSRAAISGFHSDQLVKLTAKFIQPKSTLFKNSASISVDGDFPVVGKSRIRLTGRTLTDRHFGKPRNHVRINGRTFKVEKQGDFTCISWDGVGTQPFFSKVLNLNLTSSGTLNIEKITNSSEANIFVLSGPLTFSEVSIGDFITVSGMDNPENDGTFLVTGVSDNGKTIKILNNLAVSEFSTGTATITNNSTIINDQFIIGGNSLIAGVDFAVGPTASDTAQNLASAISLLPGVTATASSNVVTIEATTPNASITLVYNDLGGGGGGSVSGPTLVGRAYTTSDFTCTSSVSEGDTVIIDGAFNVLNEGKFRVIRRFDNSIYIDNPNSVEQTVTIPSNFLSLGYTATTGFDIDSTGNKIKLKWDGTGVEPDFSVASPGDELILGTDFASANQGTFMITKAEPKLQEITRVTCVPASLITTGDYWLINSAGDTTQYYVWYDKDGGGGDPLLPGKTGISVAVSTGDSAATVANATAAAIDALSDFDAVANGSKVVINTTGYDETTDATEGIMNVNFVVEILQQGQVTFIEAINPSAVSETGITITNVLEVNSPQMKFYEYDASVPGDRFVITSDFLGSTNIGSRKITKIVDQDTVIVEGTMLDQEFTSISGFIESLIVREEKPYVGFKKIRTVLNDPFNLQRGMVVFDTLAQFDKINDSASVEMTSISKLSFDMTIKKGLDSYRYHTGLIGESNRIVYGDPRDPISYPGVAAAGAEIFIREPLLRRVKLSIDVRIQTGIPFVQVSEQVRTNITALIDGNPIGQSIAISDIVETVNIIPGVRAVAISSPLYDSANDLIKISPSEKAKIIDPVSDITVQNIQG